MQITTSNQTFASQHRLESEISHQTVLAAEPSVSFSALLIDGLRPAPDDTLNYSAGATRRTDSISPAEALDKALQALIEALFGRTKTPDEPAELAKLSDGTATRPQQTGQAGAAERLQRAPQLEIIHTREAESCSFAASDKVCLADGSERQFDVSYAMERSEESTRLSFGPQLKDPLVLDYGAPTGKLGEHEVSFDLDADGKHETLRMPGATAALLFHDRNHNGRADDGSELFGPQSGNGFADLAKLDSDGNGWIDSADPAYADIKLWQIDSQGAEHIESLATAGIGALSTGHAETPFTIKDKGEIIGQVRSSSVWLGEAGGAGVVRQIDLATTPVAPEAPEAPKPD